MDQVYTHGKVIVKGPKTLIIVQIIIKITYYTLKW